LVFAICVILGAPGCGGGGSTETGSTTFPADLPNYHTPEEWIAQFDAAGLQDYAYLGRRLVQEGKVVVVSPPTLDASFNAFAWTSEREIWINAPMFSRYPRVQHQATIFLHELIHINSGVSTHMGPWWSVQDEFAKYVQDHPMVISE
jgi:hypothetical protein